MNVVINQLKPPLLNISRPIRHNFGHSLRLRRSVLNSITLRYMIGLLDIYVDQKRSHSLNKQNKLCKSVKFIEIKQKKRQIYASNLYIPLCNYVK